MSDDSPPRAIAVATCAVTAALLALFEQWTGAVGALVAGLATHWILGPWGQPRPARRRGDSPDGPTLPPRRT